MSEYDGNEDSGFGGRAPRGTSKPGGKSFQHKGKGGGKGNKVPTPFPVQGPQPGPSDGSLAAMGYKNKASTKV